MLGGMTQTLDWDKLADTPPEYPGYPASRRSVPDTTPVIVVNDVLPPGRPDCLCEWGWRLDGWHLLYVYASCPTHGSKPYAPGRALLDLNFSDAGKAECKECGKPCPGLMCAKCTAAAKASGTVAVKDCVVCGEPLDRGSGTRPNSSSHPGECRAELHCRRSREFYAAKKAAKEAQEVNWAAGVEPGSDGVTNLRKSPSQSDLAGALCRSLWGLHPPPVDLAAVTNIRVGGAQDAAHDGHRLPFKGAFLCPHPPSPSPLTARLRAPMKRCSRT
jgi:hypothetical protein